MSHKKSYKRLLLTGVFKPFGVDDKYSETLCSMELLNNQVTREQGIHSPRSNNPSFGLYLLAENIQVETTVLDFPYWDDFIRAIDVGYYTHVGISFIVPNVLKVKRMAEYIRKASPKIKIILGGHGAGIPDLRKIVNYNEVCLGEGVEWLRNYFKEDTNRPIIHPVVLSAVKKRIYGAPNLGESGILIPGVGCKNACRFCATSHKFDKEYIPFLKTGLDVFNACLKTERRLGVFEFGIMDENFFQKPERAKELLVEMEKHNKAYTFAVFSSAEVIKKLGVNFLVRLGVNFIWIGVESKWSPYDKTKGIDLATLIKDLQDHGVTVLASAILFMDYHNGKTIKEDIDWAINLESDLLQFMHFGPIPGTKLFKDYEAAGKLLTDIPWPRQHGQDEIWFRHPHFTLPQTAEIIKNAFVKKYQKHGPGVLSMAETALKGYLRQRREAEEREKRGLVWDPKELNYVVGLNQKPDNYMLLRLVESCQHALKFRPILLSALKYAPNEKAREKARLTIHLFDQAFGKPSLIDRAKERIVRAYAYFENRRFEKNGVVMRQPRTKRQAWPDRN